MKTRLRPVHSPERLRELYARPHNHVLWGRGHHERVEETIRMGKHIEFATIADLSCGNATIAQRLKTTVEPILGDFAPAYDLCGPIEETIHQIPKVDLFICSETLEHLDDPDLVLKLIREKTKYLLLSTPIDNEGDTNEEHYWSWKAEDLAWMFAQVPFRVREFATVDSRVWNEPYCYGIWLLE